MIKEKKNTDFYTTGRQLSEQDFARISKWIKKDKQKQGILKPIRQRLRGKSTLTQQQSGTSRADE